MFKPGSRTARVVVDSEGNYSVERYKPPKNPNQEKSGESLVTASLLASNDRHVQRTESFGDHESVYLAQSMGGAVSFEPRTALDFAKKPA